MTMNYYRSIEIESHANAGYVNLLTDGETSSIECELADTNVLVNTTQFGEFCNRDDVSLSATEKADLMSAIETEFAETISN